MYKSINAELMSIFNLMYEKSGPRHWWPADTRFEVVIGAVLAQFVSWKNVTAALNNLRDAGIFSIEGICGADTGVLEELIRCTRFYRQKAKKLKALCMFVKNNYAGSLDKFLETDTRQLREELLSLYGIGEETADSIILYAAEKPVFVVDSYTRRVFGRLGFFNEDITYGDMQKFFTENLETDVKLFNEYHAQIDGIGSNYCFNKNPRCGECPLTSVCKRR